MPIDERVAKHLNGTADLRYLDADNVESPAGALSGFRVCTEDAQPLGSVDGVLISPSSRRLQYFVVQCPGFLRHKRYLVPVDAGAVLQSDPKTLRLSARKDELNLQTFAPESIPEFSDDDLIKTIFAEHAA